jgi:protein MAK11
MPKLPRGLVIAAGTYDGLLAGWEFKEKQEMELTFATAVHEGSIRSLSIAAAAKNDAPGSLLSCGYDEALRTHDWNKRLTSSGEIRTPSDFGTPVCSSFAPPSRHSTHCILGFSNGRVCIYKKRDWSVQHVLAGHDGGVASLAVHPSGKLALSGGNSDGKLKLWDLTKGRLAYVDKIEPASTQRGRTRYSPITSMVWSNDGSFYGLSHGSHITVREVATGKDLLDVDLPSKVNGITMMSGSEGLFVAAACNDGSLPVLAVEDSDDENRRAILAIEPVDAHLAREERFKCIKGVQDYFVATANSAGVVSVMNLEGAIKMIINPQDNTDDDASAGSGSESDDSEAESDDIELAVEIVTATQLGSGARITCLTAWCQEHDSEHEEIADPKENEESKQNNKKRKQEPEDDKIIRRKQNGHDITMDAAAVKKARSLVEKAKTMNDKKSKKKKKKRKA